MRKVYQSLSSVEVLHLIGKILVWKNTFVLHQSVIDYIEHRLE